MRAWMGAVQWSSLYEKPYSWSGCHMHIWWSGSLWSGLEVEFTHSLQGQPSTHTHTHTLFLCQFFSLCSDLSECLTSLSVSRRRVNKRKNALMSGIFYSNGRAYFSSMPDASQRKHFVHVEQKDNGNALKGRQQRQRSYLCTKWWENARGNLKSVWGLRAQRCVHHVISMRKTHGVCTHHPYFTESSPSDCSSSLEITVN